jgi:hypothetical protein
LARALASPIGVLITLPLLVIAVGIGILLVGRDATRGATRSMAEHQLAEQAISVQTDVKFALDQAEPLLAGLAPLADRERPLDDTLLRMHDLIIGRPGIAFVSASFPDGTFRGARLLPDGTIGMQESHPGQLQRYIAVGKQVRLVKDEHTDYDPRTRGFYELAAQQRARVWTPPYTFFMTHETGITCAEPVIDEQGQLRAVVTVDFHVNALSSYVARPALDEARSFVFTREGIVLAYPQTDKLGLPAGDQLLRHEDLHDSAFDQLFAQTLPTNELRFFELRASDGEYLASVAPIGGARAGITVPLDWFVATLVPARTLLGPTHRLERSSIIASAGALAIAVSLALLLAWNLVRMRRQVAASREEARSAEARARELGSYRLVARLGTGGMGEVWRAEHRLLSALRRDQADPARGDAGRARDRRDARAVPARGADARVDEVAPHDRDLRLRRHH